MWNISLKKDYILKKCNFPDRSGGIISNGRLEYGNKPMYRCIYIKNDNWINCKLR